MVRVCLYGRAGAVGQAVEGSGECWKDVAEDWVCRYAETVLDGRVSGGDWVCLYGRASPV